MRIKMMLTAALAAACVVGPARADITYTYVTDASNYTAAAGGAVTVNVYLDETITGGSTPLIGPGGSEAGLFSAGVAANLVSGSAALTNVTLNNNNANNAFSSSNPQSGPGFGGTSNTQQGKTFVAPSTAGILDEINFSTPAPKAYNLSTSGGTTVNQLYLGSFTVTAGSSGASTFSITSFNNASPNNTLAQANGDSTVTSPTGDLLDQDGQDPNTGVNFFGTEDTPVSFTVTVAAVPEPNGLLLCGLIAAPATGLGVWMRRRKAMIAKA